MGDGRDVSDALALLEALSGIVRQRRRELDLDAAVRLPRRRREPGVVEDLEHAVVVGQDDGRERLDALGRRGLRQMREQDGGDAVALPGVGDGKGDLRPAGRPGDVRAVADDRVLGAVSASNDRPLPASAALCAARSRLTPALK